MASDYRVKRPAERQAIFPFTANLPCANDNGMSDFKYNFFSAFRTGQWEDVLPDVAEVQDEPPEKKRIKEFSLVLKSRFIPHRIAREGNADGLMVPPGLKSRAIREIRSYVQENETKAVFSPSPVKTSPVPSVWLVAGCLILFYIVTHAAGLPLGLSNVDWLGRGAADAALILKGRVELSLTALTLHADAAHLAANLAIGGYLASALCREVGAWAWLMIIISGMAGNILNAGAHVSGHTSIGASTAVFGMVGIMAGMELSRNRNEHILRKLAPPAAGLMLLAAIGSEGERTDLGAHLFGLFSGFAVGLLYELITRRIPSWARLTGLLAGTLSILLPLWAWIVALLA